MNLILLQRYNGGRTGRYFIQTNEQYIVDLDTGENWKWENSDVLAALGNRKTLRCYRKDLYQRLIRVDNPEKIISMYFDKLL